ncbi:HipA family kinase [Paenibacillus illinoisensis]|uniref:HipA family kinase n=1 Tax=Paenibacillus illinoisensis TaxID=59845 RepID=A0ABW8HRL0_9BACL
MKKHIRIAEVLTPIETKGLSKPIMIVGNDGRDYFLKNPWIIDPKSGEKMHLDCMFLQEVLVSEIATYLNLNIPEYAVVEINKETLDRFSTLRLNGFSEGLFFASTLIKNVETNYIESCGSSPENDLLKQSWYDFYSNISNKDDFGKLIVMDLFVCNFDRFGNVGNLIVATKEEKREFFIIDHGFTFWGHVWVDSKKNMMRQIVNTELYLDMYFRKLIGASGYRFPLSGLGTLFRAIDQHINLEKDSVLPFIQTIELIEQIDKRMVYTWIENIPESWFISYDEQIERYTEFILSKKKMIRELLNTMVYNGAFHSYKGGILPWSRTT